MNISKQLVLDALIIEIEKELQAAIAAAKTAHQDATNEESKPENQYDTRALEASYVARGQAKRVAELKDALYEFKKVTLKQFTSGEAISATALIEVESEGKKSVLFFMPKGGGFSVLVNAIKIQVVTPSTPLGQALLNMRAGESVLVELGQTEREYEILRVD